MKILYVNFLSGFANNIFQYIYALLLHEKVKEKYKLIFSNKCFIRAGNKHNNPSTECNIEITPLYEYIKDNEFKYISEYYGKFNNKEKNELLKNANVNPDINNLNIDYDKDIVLSGYFQNFKYYQNKKEVIKSYLDKLLSVKLEFDFKDDDIVVHIRGDDLKHKQYSINYYTKYLNSYKNIYIITDNPKDNFVNYILKTYKNSKLITKQYSCYGSMRYLATKNFNNYEIIRDFLCLYNAKNIIMSISTFSWMGAWLSNSNKIYFPIKDKYFENLIVNDKRYIYV